MLDNRHLNYTDIEASLLNRIVDAWRENSDAKCSDLIKSRLEEIQPEDESLCALCLCKTSEAPMRRYDKRVCNACGIRLARRVNKLIDSLTADMNNGNLTHMTSHHHTNSGYLPSVEEASPVKHRPFVKRRVFGPARAIERRGQTTFKMNSSCVVQRAAILSGKEVPLLLLPFMSNVVLVGDVLVKRRPRKAVLPRRSPWF